MKAYIYDTETTGLGEGAKVIQQSAIEFGFQDGQLWNYGQLTEYYDHGIESDFGALAVHGLDLASLRSKYNALAGDTFNLSHVAPEIKVMCGHNIRFDYEMVGSPPGMQLIDTLKICQYLFPDAGSHSLSAMALQAANDYLGDFPRMLEALKSAHDAAQDVLINFDVLRWLCGITKVESLDQLIFMYNNTWRYPVKFSFGKHKGRHISEVVKSDRGYAAWCMRQPDMDPDVLEVIKRNL